MMRSFCLATFCPFRWKKEGVKEFASFGFISVGYRQQMEVLGEKLDLEPREYLSRGLWCVGWDLVSGQGPDDLKEIQMKLWELQQFGIRWEWSTDLIPGMPKESGADMFMNTFGTFKEAMQAVIKPIVTQPDWNPLQKMQRPDGTFRHGAHLPSVVQRSS